MKILILHCTYKYKGGEDTVVEEESKLLKSEGHDVELLLFSNSGNELLKVLQFPFNVFSYFKTKKTIKRFRPNIVHIHNLHFAASPSVIYAIKRSKTPFVNTLHNFRYLCPSGTLFFDEKPFLNSLTENFPWTAVKKGVYKNSKIITFWLALSMKLHQRIGTYKLSNKYIVLTDYAKQMFLNSNLNLRKNQLAVKPNFCAAADIYHSSSANHFLYVGRLTVEKGVQLLLKTFSKLGIEIRIAGDGPLKGDVIDYATRFTNIKFLGSLDKQSVFKELQSCSALVFPSLWFEGMPLIIIEAFSSGTPVIASKLGAMDSMIISNYNGFHFEPDNEKDLAEKVIGWSKLNEDQKFLFRANAISSYKNTYSPKSNAKQLLSIYNAVIEEAV